MQIQSYEKAKTEGYPTKYLTSTPQNCQGNKNMEGLRNCHKPVEAKET